MILPHENSRFFDFMRPATLAAGVAQVQQPCRLLCPSLTAQRRATAMLWWIAVNSDSPCSALTTCTQLPASSTGKSPSIPRYALDASRWTVGWPWLATPDAGGWASGAKPAGVVRPAAQAQLQNALERQIIGGLLEQRQTHNAAIDDMVNHAWDGDAWRTRHGKRITKWRY